MANNQIHVIFCSSPAENTAETTEKILRSLKSFPAGIDLMVCSNNPDIEQQMKARTGEVYKYRNSVLINHKDLDVVRTKIDSTLSDLIMNYTEISFNLTCAEPLDCYLAYSLNLGGQYYMYCLSEDDMIKPMNIRLPQQITLRKNAECMLFEIYTQGVMTFNEIKILTKKGLLGVKGKTLARDELWHKDLIKCETKSRKGVSGKSPYLWKLTDKGAEYIQTHKVELMNWRNNML